MSSIFSKIVNGDIPCYKIAEDEHHLAFLDINPLTKGHTLVIPKKEVDYIFDLNDEAFISLQLFSKKIAEALLTAISCNRIGIAVIGLEVPHAHIHLIPIQSEQDMNFANPKLSLTREEMEEIALKIREVIV
jgi:histidine triad (HIT) family protein